MLCFDENEVTLILHSLLTFFEKTYPILLSICVCSLSRLSEINAKIRNICEKNLSIANDTARVARHLFD